MAALLAITEYREIYRGPGASQTKVAEEPALNGEAAVPTGASAVALTLNSQTGIVRLTSDVAMWIKFGTGTPVAAAGDTTYLPGSGHTEYFTVKPDTALKIAAILA